MNAKCMTPQADEELRINQDTIIMQCKADVNPLDLFFAGRAYCAESKSTQIKAPKLYMSNEKMTDTVKTQEDLINIKILYEAFKDLTPAQACNCLLWDYYALADETCRRYILHRFNSDDMNPRFILESRKHTNAFDREGLLYFHGLSRLWWSGYLTYDDKLSDHYYYTKILYRRQKIAKDILMTDNSMNPSRIKGELKGLDDFMQLHPRIRNFDHCVRHCNKQLNREGAVRNLNILSAKEIADLTFSFLEKYHNSLHEKARAYA